MLQTLKLVAKFGIFIFASLLIMLFLGIGKSVYYERKGYIHPPYSSEEVLNDYYINVEMIFREAGFEQVHTIDENLGEYDPKRVTRVTIDGVTTFNKNDYFDMNADVEVYYQDDE